MDTTVHDPQRAFQNVIQSKCDIKSSEIELFEKIGEGAMAVIYRAKMKDKIVAAKKLKSSTKKDSQVRADSD